MKRLIALIVFLVIFIPSISGAAEATQATHERQGRTNTYTWNCISRSAVGNYDSGLSPVYLSDGNTTVPFVAGVSTNVTGLVWQVMIESDTGASAFAQGTGVSIVNSRGADILGTDIGKGLNSVAGTTSTRTPLLYDGTYRWLDNEPLDVRAVGTGTGRIFQGQTHGHGLT